jgi:hypothetical protein
MLHFHLGYNFKAVIIFSSTTRTYRVYGFSKIILQIAVSVINSLTKSKIYAIINNNYALIIFVPLSKETTFWLFRFQKSDLNLLFSIRTSRFFLLKYYDIQKNRITNLFVFLFAVFVNNLHSFFS